MTENPEKKIIIDEDWKKQAQAEKQKLAAESKANKEEIEENPRELPKADFSSLVSMLATQALFSMGVIAPQGEEDNVQKDSQLAKFNIDLLESIEKKTKNNLTDDENELLQGTLAQLRMAFVQVFSN